MARSRCPFPSACLLALLAAGTINAAWTQTSKPEQWNQSRVQAELTTAAGMGNVDSVKYFLRHGADLNAPSYGGVTALEKAAEHANNVTMVRFLIEAGANVNAKDGKGGTALIWAAQLGYLDNAIVLLQAGADLNAADATGRNALMYASYGGHSDTVLALMKAGAKLNQADNNGTSALMLAVWGCHADTVQILLQAGATLAATDWQKERPPHYKDFPVKQIYRGTPARVACCRKNLFSGQSRRLVKNGL